MPGRCSILVVYRIPSFLTEIQHIKLSELTQQVRDVMRGSFPDSYWIVAEVSGHKFYPNNDRHYFELVEKAEGSNEPIAKVNARAWFEGSQTIHQFETVTGQKFTTNLQVLIRVKVEFHPAHGFALILVDIDPSFTLGNLERQRLETLQRLVDENPDAVRKLGDEYITRNKNLPLNPVIQHIAIIGSPNSEGYVDFTHTLQHNQHGYQFNIDIYQSSVQGMAAEKELVNRFIDIHASEKKYDCVVLIRGGGAKTDFLVFDTYQLSRVAARFPIPIITGLGHHKDVSIVDLMVHTSVKTPTKAAEFIIAHNRRFEEEILVMQRTIIIKSQQLVAEQVHDINTTQVFIMNQTRLLVNHHQDQMQGFKQAITRQGTALLQKQQTSIHGLINAIKSGTKITVTHEQMEIKNRTEKIKTFSNKFLTNQKTKMDNFHSMIKIMDPKNILKKGFAMVVQDGKIISDPQNIQPGSEITVVMEKYDIDTQVISTKKNGTT
jgi:exodeoxyribonuclease VII large subunit